MLRKLSIAVIIIVINCSISFAAGLSDSQKEAQALVEKAVALISEKGDAALAEISQPEGGYYFKDKALYAFVYDDQVVMLAHPYKPGLIGKSYKGKPDVKGKKFRDDIVTMAIKNGSGWTDYSYQKPGEKGIHEKTAYCKLVTVKSKKYIVAAGVYK